MAARPANAPGARFLVQQMQIYGVSFDMVGKQPIVLLKTVDATSSCRSGSAIPRRPRS